MAAQADVERVSVVNSLYGKASEVLKQTLQISAEAVRSPATPEKISTLLQSTNALIRSITEAVAQNPQALSHEVVSLMAEVLENVQMTVLGAGHKVRIAEQGASQSQNFQQKMQEFTTQSDPLLAAALDGMNLTQQVAAGGKELHVNRGKLIAAYNAYSHIRDERNSRHSFTREQLEEQAEILVTMQTALLSTGKSFAIEMMPEVKQEKVAGSVTHFEVKARSETIFFETSDGRQHQVRWAELQAATTQESEGLVHAAFNTIDGAHIDVQFMPEIWERVQYEVKKEKFGQKVTTVIRIEQGSTAESVRLNDMEFTKESLEQAFASAQSTDNYFTCKAQYQDKLGNYPVKLRLYLTDVWKISRLFTSGALWEEKTPQTDLLKIQVHTQIAQIESPVNPFIKSVPPESIPAQTIQSAVERVIRKNDIAAIAKRFKDNNPEQEKVFVSLVNRIAQDVARNAGVTLTDLSDSAQVRNFDAIVGIALEVSHYTSAFCYRLERDLARLSNGDADTALGLARQLATTEFRKIEARLLDPTMEVRKTKQGAQIGQGGLHPEAPPVDEALRRKGRLWAQLTEQQKQGDPRQLDNQATAGKVGLLKEMCEAHSPIVKSSFSAIPRGQDYFYIQFKPVDEAQQKAYDARSAYVNDAQDLFAGQVAVNPAEVLRTPTGKLKELFPALETIGREVKVHLMPQTEDELAVVEQLLTLLSSEKGLAIRDSIGAIKVRLVGNNANSQDRLPEIVIYTQDITANQVVALIEQEFSQMRGTGRAPRYNREVSNGLVYFAQSGGDLKDKLAQFGLLQKFFEKGGDFAQLRI